MKNVIQEIVHRIFNATSNFSALYQVVEKQQNCWTKNQCPEKWSSKIVNHTLGKIISGGNDQLKTTKKALKK